MADTAIEWADSVWNPTTGCDKVSPGCDNCYALTMAKRLKAMGSAKYQTDGDSRTSGSGFGLATHDDALIIPLRWRKPRRVFVNSMSDLFHPKVTDEFIARVFAVMAAAPQHTFQVLTKRPKRMRALLGSDAFLASVGIHWMNNDSLPDDTVWPGWPLPNVWLGTSVEDQQRADERIPPLLETPAAVRFLSCEPLLGPVDLTPWLDCEHDSASGGLAHDGAAWVCDQCGARWRDVADSDGPCWSSRIGPFRKDYEAGTGLGWIIVGGESGPGARPMHPQWARTLRDQSVDAGVPFLFKQWGAWVEGGDGITVGRWIDSTDGRRYSTWSPTRVLMTQVGKHAAGRELEGRTWDEFPEGGGTE